MIIWLASYPRSGNTLLRIALNRLYGLRSSVVYDQDGVAERLGGELVGFEARPDYAEARSGGVNVIKTHRQRDRKVSDYDAAICVVRDGRDALVSYARLLTEDDPGVYETKLRELIEQDSPTGTGSWGANVLSWLHRPLNNSVMIRFEDVARDPASAVEQAVSRVAPSLRPLENAVIPPFQELSATDPGFFRRGAAGAWRDDMPAALHDLFWSRADNRAAMDLLGYA